MLKVLRKSYRKAIDLWW